MLTLKYFLSIFMVINLCFSVNNNHIILSINIIFLHKNHILPKNTETQSYFCYFYEKLNNFMFFYNSPLFSPTFLSNCLYFSGKLFLIFRFLIIIAISIWVMEFNWIFLKWRIEFFQFDRKTNIFVVQLLKQFTVRLKWNSVKWKYFPENTLHLFSLTCELFLHTFQVTSEL